MSGVLALVILTILLCLLLIYFQIEAIKARDELREYKSYCNLSFEAIKAQNEFKRHCSLPKSHFIFDSRNQMIEHIATKLIPSIIFAKNASLGMLYKVSLMSLKKMVSILGFIKRVIAMAITGLRNVISEHSIKR